MAEEPTITWEKLFAGLDPKKTELTRILQIKNKMEECFAAGQGLPDEHRPNGKVTPI